MTGIVLADSEPVVRLGIGRLLASFTDLEVQGEAANDSDLVELLGEVAPQLVIIEVLAEQMHGIEVIRSCCIAGVLPRFLVFSSHDVCDVLEAFRAGASGFVSKLADPAELKRGIDVVCSGRTYIPSGVLSLLVAERGAGLPAHAGLTGRERQVLRSVASGMSNKEVARHLGIAIRTVEAHRASFMRKLGVHNSAGITRYAIRAGLIAL